MKSVVLKTEPGLWTVGHYGPQGDWNPLKDYGDLDEAMTACAKLNGYVWDENDAD